MKRIAYEVFDVMGRNPLIDIALECERIALEDEYFVTRKLYPNVDFYTGLIYQSMGFPMTMFPVLFAIPRTSGWIAQWQEMLLDPEQKISRPRQVYSGYDLRSYVAARPPQLRDRFRPRRGDPILASARGASVGPLDLENDCHRPDLWQNGLLS